MIRFDGGAPMGWTSKSEDVQRDIDEAEFLLKRVTDDELASKLRTKLGKIKTDVVQLLNYATTTEILVLSDKLSEQIGVNEALHAELERAKREQQIQLEQSKQRELSLKGQNQKLRQDLEASQKSVRQLQARLGEHEQLGVITRRRR